MNERLRLKFGRIVAAARTWESDLELWALAEELQHAYVQQHERNLHLHMAYTSVTSVSIRRRDNIELSAIIYLGGSDLRRLQEFGLWSAAFEPVTSYFSIYTRAAAVYTDRTTPAMNLNQTYTIVNITDRVYIGADEPFNDIDFLHQTFGVGCARTVKYYNGAWVAVAGLVDNTTLFTVNSNMRFTLPTDWVKTTQGDELPNKYWIEITFSAAATKPVWRYTRPNIPIMILLERSIDNGITWNWYHDELYYPNLWVIEKVLTRFQVGGRHDFMQLEIVEGM